MEQKVFCLFIFNSVFSLHRSVHLLWVWDEMCIFFFFKHQCLGSSLICKEHYGSNNVEVSAGVKVNVLGKT